MRRAATALLGVALLAGAAPASAQPMRAEPGGSRVAPILPALKLEGSTEGSAKLEVGADIVVRASDSIDLSFAPSFEVTTADGLAALFSTEEADEAGAMPWRAGGTVSLYYLGEPVSRTAIAAFRDSDLRMKSSAVARCQVVCAQGPEEGSCKNFRAALGQVQSASSISPEDLCSDGQALWLEYERHIARELRGMYPDLTVSAKAVAGRDSFTYVAEDPDQTPLALHEDERHTTYEIGTSLAWVTPVPLGWGSMLTLEGSFRVTAGYEASPVSAEWCTPVGSVPRQDGSGADEAEACTTGTFGAPASSTKMRGALRVGALNRLQDLWRLALGPYVVRDGDSYAIGVEAPLYLNFASAPPEYVGDYKGLLAVTPRAEWSVRGDGFPESRFVLTLALLGQRSFFGAAFD
ncbi:hypothetical protein BE04_25025 [Sorangium cellulosum]|uniref:Secreted protein n=1 Tax=Sorangium cellulosum TaxID=56 RepID=A0A150PEE0_SORCE|nr:hypothetical protein BE04_25025 [Sorangium cellulosum]